MFARQERRYPALEAMRFLDERSLLGMPRREATLNDLLPIVPFRIPYPTSMARKGLLHRFRKTHRGGNLTTRIVLTSVKGLVHSLRMVWVDRAPMDRCYELNQPFIFAYWHSDLILATRVGAEEQKRRPIVLMSSPSRDGYLVAEMMAREGMTIVRSSSKRRGMEGFMTFAKALKSGMNGSLAVDGPRGPCRQVKEGVIRLSQISGVPILPCAVGYELRIVTRSWDRLRIPFPLSRAAAICGAPMFIDKDLPREEASAASARLGSVLMDLRQRLPYDRD